MKKWSVIILNLTLIAVSQTWAVSSSASFKVTSEILDSGSSNGTSASFRILAKTRGYQVGGITSPSFIFGAGFLKSAYSFVAPPILAPIITSITPNMADNTGPVNITALAGANFQTGVTVKLIKSGQPDIVATNVAVSAGKITCTFDLTGKAAGSWDVVVTNPDGSSGSLPAAFKIAFAAPTITSITPATGDNNAVVSITDLSGTNFRNGAQVKLVKTGETDIIGENIVVISPTKITGHFNLVGKTVGQWDVVVTNDDGQSATLRQGFKVQSPTVQIVGPVQITKQPFNPDVESTSIKYTLSKDVDIDVEFFNLRGERIYVFNASAGSAGATAGVNEVEWNGVTAFKQKASSGVYVVMVNAKVDGTIKTLAKTKIAVVK